MRLYTSKDADARLGATVYVDAPEGVYHAAVFVMASRDQTIVICDDSGEHVISLLHAKVYVI